MIAAIWRRSRVSVCRRSDATGDCGSEYWERILRIGTNNGTFWLAELREVKIS